MPLTRYGSAFSLLLDGHGDPFIVFAPVFLSSILPTSFAREGMEVVGTVSGLITVIASVTAVAKRLNEVRDRYNNVALNTTLVASQASGSAVS